MTQQVMKPIGGKTALKAVGVELQRLHCVRREDKRSFTEKKSEEEKIRNPSANCHRFLFVFWQDSVVRKKLPRYQN